MFRPEHLEDYGHRESGKTQMGHPESTERTVRRIVSPAPSSHPNDNDFDGDVDSNKEGDDDGETFVYENYNLKELPLEVIETIESRRTLRKLSLKGNKLVSIPSSLGQLKQLYYLNLSHNNLTEVPYCISGLKNLEILDMSNNGLRILPAFLAKLPQLIGLSVVANNLYVLPPVIADLPKLVILEIEDNPIRFPSELEEPSESDDQESWLSAVRQYIAANRVELENAVRARSGSLNQKATEEKPLRLIPERLRSASESGSSLRSAKRMGFVMSQNASDQSYVANLHARGLSYDAHMVESAVAGSQIPSSYGNLQIQPHSQSLSGPPGPLNLPLDMSNEGTTSGNANALSEFANPRSLGSLSATNAEHNDLQPPPPRSPLSRSPFGSPWGSPRPSVADSEPQSAVSGRLSTLAEEHDGADTEGGEVMEPTATRESSTASTDLAPNIPTFRRASSALPSFTETVPESPYEHEDSLDTSPPVVFKDSYQDNGAIPKSANMPVSTSASSSISGASASGSHGRQASSPSSSLATPTSASTNALESIAFALEEFSSVMFSIWNFLPPAIMTSLREAQESLNTKKYPKALTLFSILLEKLSSPTTFHHIASKLSRRQLRKYATSIMLIFPELEAAWRILQQSQLVPLMIDTNAQHQSWAQDEQLHNQLDYATKGAQVVLALLNDVVAKSAVAAADGPEPTSTMASQVRDLSSVCIKCSSATRSVRKILDSQAATHARMLQITERRRFWEEVNNFLKAVISTLAVVKAALPDMPLLADKRVRAEVANLTKVAKEIPPLLEQSSYRLLLDANLAPIPDTNELNPSGTGQSGALDSSTGIPTPSLITNQIQYHHHQSAGQSPFAPNMSAGFQQPMSSQVSLPPPTPLTASLGAAAQALISPSDRGERPADGYIQFGLHAHMENNPN